MKLPHVAILLGFAFLAQTATAANNEFGLRRLLLDLLEKELLEGKKSDDTIKKSSVNDGTLETKDDPNNPRLVILESMAIVVEGRPADMAEELKFTDLGEVAHKTFTIKEGCKYKIRLDFLVKREIVQGLKYFQQIYRKGIRVDKFSLMIGSYGPGSQFYSTDVIEAPKGILARGPYNVKSEVRDGDGNTLAEWQWNYDIKTDWAN